jgi:hypothetical protein
MQPEEKENICRIEDWLEIELLLGNGLRTQRCKAIGIDEEEEEA